MCLYVKHPAVACDWVMEKRTERVFLFIGLNTDGKSEGDQPLVNIFRQERWMAIGLENGPTIVRNAKFQTFDFCVDEVYRAGLVIG